MASCPPAEALLLGRPNRSWQAAVQAAAACRPDGIPMTDSDTESEDGSEAYLPESEAAGLQSEGGSGDDASSEAVNEVSGSEDGSAQSGENDVMSGGESGPEV